MTDDEQKYCVNCGIVINTKSMQNFVRNVAGEPQPTEYKDGWYCGRCSKIKQDKARERIK